MTGLWWKAGLQSCRERWTDGVAHCMVGFQSQAPDTRI